MNTKSNKVTKLLSWMLVLTMMMTVVLPTAVFASYPATVTTTLGDSSIIVNTETEFTVTTDPGSVSAMVLGNFEITADESDITSLEYFATDLNVWATLPITVNGNKLVGSFGPAATGFPLIDATSEFRVTFAEAGDYDVRVSVVEFGTDNVIAYNDVTVAVEEPGTISTDIIGKRILVNEAMEFGVSTVANGHAGALVKGKLELVADAADIASLEYYETTPGMEGYHSFPTTVDGNKIVGEFGPASGFPMMDATSKFRITFANEGTYTATVSVYDVTSGDEICKQNVIVKAIIPGTVSTDLGSATLFTGDEVEYGVTTVANGDAGTMVKGRFEIEADAADIAMLEYFETSGVSEYKTLPTTVVGNKLVGEFGPTTGFPMMDATSKFKIKFANDGDYSAKIFVYNVENDEVLCEDEVAVSVINYADYTDLDAAILNTETYDPNDYTTASYNVLKTAIDNAKAVDRKLAESQQGTIDALKVAINEAIAGLVSFADITFSATAVTGNVNANYAKADKIIVVFSEPLATDVDTIKAKFNNVAIESVTKNNESVYTLNLAENHALENGLALTLTPEEKIFTAAGKAINPCSAIVKGNVKDVAALVTANTMTATIVKASTMPGVNKDDTIVFVFNAPVKDTPDYIDFDELKAYPLTGAGNAVYVITFNGGETVPTSFTYGTMNATPTGSFGNPVAPVVKKVIAVENSKDAHFTGDEIVVYFDRPTNHVEITPAIALAKLGFEISENAQWTENDTVLTFKLVADSAVSNGMTINLDGLGIQDEYGTIDYVAEDLTLGGAFITAVAPKVMKVVAIDNDGTANTEGDSIIVYFDRNTNETTDGTLTGNLAGANYEWIDAQTLKITLGDADISSDDKIDISTIQIKDSYGLVDATGLTNIPLEGGFGTAITPEVVKVTAVSVTGNATATKDDKIVIAFNTKVDKSAVTNIVAENGTLGTGFSYANNVSWDDSKGTSVATVELGHNPTIKIGETVLKFVGDIYDLSGEETCSNSNYMVVADGAFGVTITPALMSATVVKVSNTPTAQAGDKIVFVFTTPTNTPENNTVPKSIIPLFENDFGTGASGSWSANGTIYTVTLGEDADVEDNDSITFTNDNSDVELKDYYNITKVADKAVTLKGSFGKANRPELLSATIVKNKTAPKAQKGDQIVFVFSAMTNGGKNDIELPNIITSLSDKFGSNAKGEWSSKGTVYTVTLGDGPTIADTDTITLTENSGFMDVHEIETVKGGTAIALDGTFGEEVVQNLQVSSVIAYSEGSRNKVKVIFNVETNLTTVANSSFKTALGEANKVNDKCIFGEAFDIDVTAQELIITLDNTGYSVTDTTVLNLAGLGIKSVSGGELTGTIPACDGYFVPVVEDVVVQDDGVTVVVYFSARTDGNKDAAKAAVLAQKALFGSTANQNVEWKNNNTELHITMSDDNTMADDAYIVLNDFEIYDEFSKTHKVVGQYNVDTEKLDYKVLTFVVYANAINTENAAREDVTKAKDGDELVIEFNRATDEPDNMLANLALENAEDKFGEGATAVWNSDKKLVITLGTGSVISTSSKIIVKNVKFANGTGKLSQSNASESEAIAITGKFDGREYWIDSATKAVANGRTRITVSLTKSAIATEATNVFAICQAYNSKNTVETISAIGVPDKATNSFIFDFNATNLTDFEVVVLKGDYSAMNAGVDVYSDTIKPTTAE